MATKDSKQRLFEVMERVAPDFKAPAMKDLGIKESDDKWIQKAVNPKHKGFCTPESKPTCTPERKALADRFKKGDLSEGNLEFGAEPQEEKTIEQKYDELKAEVDRLYALIHDEEGQEDQGLNIEVEPEAGEEGDGDNDADDKPEEKKENPFAALQEGKRKK